MCECFITSNMKLLVITFNRYRTEYQSGIFLTFHILTHSYSKLFWKFDKQKTKKLFQKKTFSIISSKIFLIVFSSKIIFHLKTRIFLFYLFPPYLYIHPPSLFFSQIQNRSINPNIKIIYLLYR